MNQRPLGYEPFSNRDWSQRATNNASQIGPFSRRCLWASLALVGSNFLGNSWVSWFAAPSLRPHPTTYPLRYHISAIRHRLFQPVGLHSQYIAAAVASGAPLRTRPAQSGVHVKYRMTLPSPSILRSTGVPLQHWGGTTDVRVPRDHDSPARRVPDGNR